MSGKLRIGPVLVAAVIAVGLFARPACAAAILTCGPATGYGYYLRGGVVPDSDVGWHEDAISGGETRLVQDGDGFDIVFRDATGQTRSSRAEGAAVVPIVVQSGLVILISAYQGPQPTLEHYLFRWDASGKGEVVWRIDRATLSISKASLYHADCSAP